MSEPNLERAAHNVGQAMQIGTAAALHKLHDALKIIACADGTSEISAACYDQLAAIDHTPPNEIPEPVGRSDPPRRATKRGKK